MFIEDFQNEDFAHEIQETMKRLSGPSIPSWEDPFSATATGSVNHDTNIANTMKQLADTGGELEGMDTSAAEMMGENLMQNMMKQFEKLGEKVG